MIIIYRNIFKNVKNMEESEETKATEDGVCIFCCFFFYLNLCLFVCFRLVCTFMLHGN